MKKKLLSIHEKIMLVNLEGNNWEPDGAQLMYIASYQDWGAHKDTLEETKKEIIDEGGTPQKVKITITIHAEHLN